MQQDERVLIYGQRDATRSFFLALFEGLTDLFILFSGSLGVGTLALLALGTPGFVLELTFEGFLDEVLKKWVRLGGGGSGG